MQSSVDLPAPSRRADRGGRASIYGLALLGGALLAYAISDDSFLGGPPGFGRVQQALAVAGAGSFTALLLPGRWRMRILLAAVSALLASAAMEVLLRPYWVPRLFVPFRFDEELLCARVPGRKAIHELDAANDHRAIDHSINDAGYRGEPLLSQGSAYRVAVFGDSFIDAFYTPLEESFCERLEDEIAERIGRACEVVNCGVAGYGPDQSLLRLRRELAALRPDLVVFSVFTGNDFGDLERNKLFELDAQGALVRRRAELAPAERARLSIGTRESVILRLLRKRSPRGTDPALLPRTDPGDGGRAMLAHYLANAEAEHADYSASSIVQNINVDLFNADCALTPDAPSARHRRALLTAILREVNAELARAAIPGIVLVIPYVLDVCPRSEYRVEPAEHPAYRPENLRDAALEACRQAELEACDLFESFRVEGCREFFLRGWDDHWSSAGQALGARVLAERLRQLELLPTVGR